MFCDRNGVLVKLDNNMQGIRDWTIPVWCNNMFIAQKLHDHDHNYSHDNANSHELSSTRNSKIVTVCLFLIHRIVTSVTTRTMTKYVEEACIAVQPGFDWSLSAKVALTHSARGFR